MVSQTRTPASTQLPSVTVTGVQRSYALEARTSRDRPTRAIPEPRARDAAHLNPHVGSRSWLRCARSCPSVGSDSGTSSGWVRF